jgi:RNA polymerase sigma-70 factor (ECF subfamily)
LSAQDIRDRSEKELVERARRGETAAFEALIRSHDTKIRSFALNITGGKHALANDIMQEALIRAYDNIATFRGDCSFLGWLWRILKNDFLRYQRHVDASRETALEEPGTMVDPTIPTTEESVIQEERIGHLRQLVSRLSIEDQEVITLIEFQGLTLEETAVLLDLSLEAIKSRLYRARQRLAESVKKNKNLF